MFIVFEGIDGTGKSTQVKMLAEALTQKGHEVITSFEPTNGQYGSIVRNSATTGRLSAEEELELFLKDRKEHLDTLILPALKEEKIVILDRYYFSTIAYQGARGLDPKAIREANEAFALKPDLVLLLDQPIDVSLERIGARDGEGNFFEKRENLEKCASLFAEIDDDCIQLIDSNRPAEEVHEEVRRLVMGWMM